MMVGVAGFEPATLWSQTRCATRLRYTPIRVLIQQLLIISMYKDTKIKRNLNKIWYITKHDYYLPLRKETIQN